VSLPVGTHATSVVAGTPAGSQFAASVHAVPAPPVNVLVHAGAAAASCCVTTGVVVVVVAGGAVVVVVGGTVVVVVGSGLVVVVVAGRVVVVVVGGCVVGGATVVVVGAVSAREGVARTTGTAVPRTAVTARTANPRPPQDMARIRPLGHGPANRGDYVYDKSHSDRPTVLMPQSWA
jgi:hypothetical protein